MAQRLVDIYRPGDAVEVLFEAEEMREWRRARVMGPQHPGVWIVTDDDRHPWFVTNGRRIRPFNPTPRPEAS